MVGVERDGFRVTAVQSSGRGHDSVRLVPCDYLISTMPVRDLTRFLDAEDFAPDAESPARFPIATS